MCHPEHRETAMGFIWDLIQHSQIQDTHDRAAGLEQRVARLEDEVRRTNETLVRLLERLEQRFGEDLNGDGRVG
jgi:chaperonin cofactor prefoldin